METSDLERLRQAVATTPEDVTARFALLQALVAASAWEEAETVSEPFDHATTLPEGAHALLGLIFGKRQRWQAAVEHYRLALEQQPDDPLLWFNLGTTLAEHGELTAAIEYLEKVTDACETWAEAHYNLGTVFLREGRYHDAIKAFERALEQREMYPEAHFSRGNAHAMLGVVDDGTLDYYEVDCAVNAYKQAIQQRPAYSAALYNLGMLYGRMSSSEGLRVWDQYLELDTDNNDADDIWRIRAQEYRRDLQDRLGLD